ncbi:MAG: histidine phosphatase family protein [Gammaproteobacteria bacterium]|nr:histidine phosphatase family protein [Gammaproteobacteria bacterium]
MIKRLVMLMLALGVAACAGQPAAMPEPDSAAQVEIFPRDANPEFEGPRGDLFSVHLYRHAEKLTGTDPQLTELGHARARHLGEHLSRPSVAVSRVWSSPYQRTMQTALPLAQKLGLEIDIYDPRAQRDLVLALHESASDAAVFGHSNTIPELAAMLCQCEVEAMPESEYERGYVVVLGRGVSELYEVDMTRSWTDRPVPAD